MTDPQRFVQKLRKPPGAHNWAKNIRRRRDDLAISLYNTAVHGPHHSLKLVTDVIRDVVVDGIDDDTSYKCISRISNDRVRAYGYEILNAILPYIRLKGWKGIQIFKDMQEFYPVAANVRVPVRPTFVINDNGKITPYFVICWTQIGLSSYQRRVLSTLIQEAILSLEDFEGSDAVIVCVPRHSFSKSERYVTEWKVSDYEVLNSEEKADLFARYGAALEDAERMILENLG